MPPTPIKKVKKKAIWDDEDVLKLTQKKATVIALPAASLAAAVEAADDDAPPKKKAAAPKKKRVAAAEEESAEGKPRSAKRVKRAPAPAPASDDSVTDDEQQQQQLQQHAAAYDEMLRREAEEEPGDEEADDSLGDDARDDARLAVSKFNLSAETVQALRNRGVEALFPIQAACFDHLNAGKDLIGRARTGMGKTLAFALPLVEKVLALRKQTGTMRRPGRKPMGLVMAPTRELAQQVASEVQSVAPGLESYCVYGGTPMGPSCTALRAGLDLVIGTPGRIKDLAERGVLLLDEIAFAALDEADQMLDMGFAEDMQAILGQCTLKGRQTCLFSATLPAWVREVAPTYMHTTPTIVDLVGDKDVKASTDVRHLAIGAPGPFAMRGATINDVIAMYASSTGRVIVFCDTKAECDSLSSSEALKVECKVLHGDIPQATREKVMAAFRSGRFRVLIATDVAARGLS